MLKKLALAGAMLAGIALVALAANAPTYTDVAGRLLDAQGVVLIDTTGQPYNASGGGAATVTGNVASGAADSGNPVKVGGKVNTTLPVFVDGNRADAQLDTSGNTRVVLAAKQIAGSDGVANGNLATVFLQSETTAAVVRPLAVAPWLYTGTTWERQTTCASTVAVTAAAGTTQIVALSGSTVVRVCSYSLSMAAAGAGTVKFVYGTGASCGTGTTDISAAMPLAANQNMTASAANGSLLRGLAANALCLTVATNTVTGYVTYAQF